MNTSDPLPFELNPTMTQAANPVSDLTNPVNTGSPDSGGATETDLVAAADRATRTAEFKLLATLFGGMLLLVAVLARFLFDAGEVVEGADRAVNLHSQLLALAAAIVLGLPILWAAFQDLAAQFRGKAHEAHFELLVALAFIASFAAGRYMESAAIAFFMLVASFIEERTATGAQKQIEALIRITPTRASRLMADGSEAEVAAKDLNPGDIVVIRPGDNIPGDGIVVSGLSAVNQANITGESLPVEKAEGDEVFAGTINESGVMNVRITRAEADSTLSKVQDLILQASESKPAVIRMLDQYAGFYTPVVLMIAGIILFFSKDLDRVISFLLICCPIEILIAAPSAMVASLTTAARLGVLIKDVTILEVARRVTAIVLDKTGTLTTGRLSVTRLNPTDGTDAATLLKLASSVEANSKHPVARAVVEMAEKARITRLAVSDFSEVTGRGVSAMIEGHQITCGRAAFVTETGVDLTGLDTSAGDGLSLLFVARDGQALGWIGLEDQPRESSKSAMVELGELGVKHRIMITGDRPSPARRVAKLVGITEFEAEALPGDKLNLVEDLRARGHTVAVVGDGVNDGPALAAGNLSIAMGAAGSDVAIHSASVALMSDSLNRIPFLIYLSRRTVTVIRQNLIGLLIYILLMLALLAFGLINPILAALAHGVASLAVLFNSARLVREGEYLEEFAAANTGPQARVQTERVADES